MFPKIGGVLLIILEIYCETSKAVRERHFTKMSEGFGRAQDKEHHRYTYVLMIYRVRRQMSADLLVNAMFIHQCRLT